MTCLECAKSTTLHAAIKWRNGSRAALLHGRGFVRANRMHVLDGFGQRRPFDELHRVGLQSYLVLHEAEHGDNSRVLETGGDLGFGPKLRSRLRYQAGTSVGSPCRRRYGRARGPWPCRRLPSPLPMGLDDLISAGLAFGGTWLLGRNRRFKGIRDLSLPFDDSLYSPLHCEDEGRLGETARRPRRFKNFCLTNLIPAIQSRFNSLPERVAVFMHGWPPIRVKCLSTHQRPCSTKRRPARSWGRNTLHFALFIPRRHGSFREWPVICAKPSCDPGRSSRRYPSSSCP